MNEKKFSALPQKDAKLLYEYISSQGLKPQIDAITSSKRLTVVSAGAGTGKTWTLAWRFIWAALTRSDVRDILTLTFTEKAAAEMKSRIADLLRGLEGKMSKSVGFSPALRDRRDQALTYLDQAYISTIHGFGFRTISEAGISLPIEPLPHIVKDAEEEDFWNNLKCALDRLDYKWFSNGMDKEYSDKVKVLFNKPDIQDAVNFWGPAKIADFAPKFESMMSDFGYTPSGILEECESERLACLDSALDKLKPIALAYFMPLALAWKDVFDSGEVPVGGKAQTAFERLRSKWAAIDILQGTACVDLCLEAYDAFKGARGKIQLKDREITISVWRKKVEEQLASARLLKDGWSENERRAHRCLLSLGWAAWRKWQGFKTARGLISFPDMITLAAKVISESPEYASHFKETLVDEFQDTNAQQDSLLKEIAKASGARMFIVGDLKQSIYRFRHAEPALFASYMNSAGDMDYITLDTSFRSCSKVLTCVNHRFSSLWEKGLSQNLKVGYEALVSSKTPDPLREDVSLPIERIFEGFDIDEGPLEVKEDGTSKAKLEKTASVRDRLAYRLARRLVHLKEEERTVWDKEKKALRPIKWSDMAILVPTRTYYKALEEAFRDADVPAAFNDSKSFYQRPEIRDIGSLVALFADKTDKIALSGYLCSPFSGLTQSQAQELIPKLADPPLESLASYYPDLAAKLESLCRTAEFEGSARGVSALLNDLSFLDRMEARKRAGVIANIRRAVFLLEGYDANCGPTPVGAAAYLKRALKGGIEMYEANSDVGEDCVAVSTIHASKGLEYPLVAVFGLEHSVKGKRAGGNVSPSSNMLAVSGAFPDVWKEDEKEECRLLSVHKALEEQAEYEELQRLYYVALTRARDGLILCGTLHKPSEKRSAGYADDMSFFSIEEKAGDIEKQQEAQEDKEEGPVRRRIEIEPIEVPRDVAPISNRHHALSSVNATSYARWQMCHAAWRMAHREHLDLLWSGKSAFQDEAGGKDFGNVAHWLMSEWDFTDDGDDGFEKLMSKSDGELPPEYRSVWRNDDAKADLRKINETLKSDPFKTNLLKRLLKAKESGELNRERYFEYPITIPGTWQTVKLVGKVDAYWVEYDKNWKPEKKLCIRDYKTTRQLKGDQAQQWIFDLYAHQLKCYALALRKTYPDYAHLKLDLAIYNLRTGKEIPIAPMYEEKEKELENSIIFFAQEAVKTDPRAFLPNKAMCSRCAYNAGCIAKEIAKIT